LARAWFLLWVPGVRAFCSALLLMSSAALAQELSPPPLVPLDAPPRTPLGPRAQPAPPAEAPPLPTSMPTYLERCFSVPGQVWIPATDGRYSFVNSATSSAPLSSFHTAQPAGPTTTGSGGGSSGGGGSIDGKALLVLAVVVVAVLPIIVYAADSDAPAVVEQRFHCPSFGLDAVGGVDLGAQGPTGTGSGRVTFGYAYFGSDFQFDLSPGSINSWSGHLLLRIAPKEHIEPNLAFGFRSLSKGGVTRNGLEVGVPHRYVLWREGLRQFSIELRPTLMFGLGAFDVGLEAAALIPLVEPLHLRVGGKVQSFGNEVIGGFNAGLTFTL
jgi:hypothetical protein